MTPAPQLTPEIREAMRTLAALLGCAAEPDREAATCYAAVVQAALDRAQQRLDDVLRGQRALQDQTVRIRRALGVPEGAKGDTEDYARELLRQVRDMQKLLRLRSSPPEETQRVAPVDVSVAYTFCERMAKQVTPYEYVITDADVREAYEAWTALDLAGLAGPSVSPSVPKEEDRP